MARIRLPEVSEMTGAEKKQYDRFQTNLTRAMLRTSTCTPAYLSLGGSFTAGKLADKDREFVIMRVGALSQSPYERMQHYDMARAAGWSEAQIDIIENGGSLDGHWDAIIAFVDECVANVRVSDETFDAVRAFYDETQVAELTLLIGHYMMTARFLEVLKVDVDPPGDWSNVTYL